VTSHKDMLVLELQAIEAWDATYYRDSPHTRGDMDAFYARQERRRDLLELIMCESAPVAIRRCLRTPED
jgi:hypothetical protein